MRAIMVTAYARMIWILAAITVAVVFAAVQAWRKCWWDPVRRTHYSLLAGACVAFVLAVGTQGLL